MIFSASSQGRQADKMPSVFYGQQGENFHIGPTWFSHLHEASKKHSTKNHLAKLFSDAL
jgi:ribosomal protein L25 (general stress protein Ctc)